MFLPRYSGKKSKQFWKKINSYKGLKWHFLYTLGCCLQDLEHRVLKEINACEIKKKK